MQDFKSKAVWDTVVERFQKMLVGWKRQDLTIGLFALIRSTFLSLPTYYMSVYTIPILVANRLEKLPPALK